MKTFTDFLTLINNLKLPVGNLGISRQSMPQIDDNRQDVFIQALGARHINVTDEEVPTSTLHLTQSEVNKDKIWKLMGILRKKKGMRAIFVTQDNFVLDGSHRFVAKLNHGKNTRIKIKRIDMPVRQLLELLKFNRHEFGVRYRSYSGEELE